MSKETYYKQCLLVKNEGQKEHHIVSFIPEKFAEIGRTVQLKEGEVWSDGWQVKSANHRTHEDFLPDPHKFIKAHRRATGDSQRRLKD